MRLLKVNEKHGEVSLEEYYGENIPPYAILSHARTATKDEVTFKDIMEDTARSKAGYKMIEFCRDQAVKDGLQFFWIDICCIDRSNKTELLKAIISLPSCFKNAATCYVYLDDIHSLSLTQRGSTVRSRFFTRTWSLQELSAPAKVQFFSQDGVLLGSKESLEQEIHERIGIYRQALRGRSLAEFRAVNPLAWMKYCLATRTKDHAYSLPGIFNVSMPLLYGEGRESAFERLAWEIEGYSRWRGGRLSQPERIFGVWETQPLNENISRLPRDVAPPGLGSTDDDEIDYVFSDLPSESPSLISDSSISSRQDKYNDVVEHLVEIFCAEELIDHLYHELVEHLGVYEFRHMHQQFLKSYFKELGLEIKNEHERAAVRLLRSKCYTDEATSLILKSMQPYGSSGQSRLTRDTLAKRKTERNYNLNQMLKGLLVGARPNQDLKKDYDVDDDFGDLASESSGPLAEPEDEPLVEDRQSPLQAIDAFLIGGKAFAQFELKLACLLYPSQSLSHVLSSESIFVFAQYISRHLHDTTDKYKQKVLELRADGQSNTKIAEFLLEKSASSPRISSEEDVLTPNEPDNVLDITETFTKAKNASVNRQILVGEEALIEYGRKEQGKKLEEQEKKLEEQGKLLKEQGKLLEEHERLVRGDSLQLITWTCSCGAQLSDSYTEIIPGSLNRFQQYLRQENAPRSGSRQSLWDSLMAWTNGQPSAEIDSPNQASATAGNETPQAARHKGGSAIGGTPKDPGLGSATDSPPFSQSTAVSNPLRPLNPPTHPAVSYLLLCLPEGLSGLRLHHQQILHPTQQRSLPNQVVNDQQLFHLLRKKYASARRLYFSRFWPKTVIRVSLAYFLVDLSDYVELRHYACYDGRVNCQCIPPPDMIQPAIDAQYYCVPREPPFKPPIGTNYLTHYFQNPSCIKSEHLTYTLNQVPKRLGQCMPKSGSERVKAWGLEFEEGWDRGRVRNAIFGLVVVGCLVFAVLWSVLLRNVQSAFAVSSFLVAVVAAIGGYIASAEPRIVHK